MPAPVTIRLMTFLEITFLHFYRRFQMQTALRHKFHHLFTVCFSRRIWIGCLPTVQVSSFYFEQGLAPSTQRTYKVATKRFHDFCTSISVYNPFPLSEQLLCQFATFLAEGLAVPSIKTSLAAVRNMNISLGFPDLQNNSSLLLLRHVQLGIQKVQASKQSSTKRTRLPITLGLLDQLHSL